MLELGVVVVEVAIIGIKRDRLRVCLLGLVVVERAFLGTSDIEPCARRGFGVGGLLEDEHGAVVIRLFKVELTQREKDFDSLRTLGCRVLQRILLGVGVVRLLGRLGEGEIEVVGIIAGPGRFIQRGLGGPHIASGPYTLLTSVR